MRIESLMAHAHSDGVLTKMRLAPEAMATRVVDDKLLVPGC